VKLGDTLGLVLLLDGVVVGGFLGGVDQLVGQALSDRLDVTECGLVSSRSHVDGLTTDGTGASNTSSLHGADMITALTSTCKGKELGNVPLSEELDLGKIALELKGGSKVHGLVYCPFVAKLG
ncbi:hypothetical protein PRIPAC_76237, partial [Pristionchus pacificus]|uniref:Uncharacterized protein n=1 Tax=Pristionchus pacificus TaxID=54126 RepID=A0A2A6C027_PRIPA